MKRKVLRIALFDVRHATLGLHAYQMPLAIGLLAGYARKIVKEAELDIKLYIFPEKFLKEFRSWKPDIVGGSFYTWNRELNLFLLKKVKESLPNTITVLGGPEVEKDTEKQKEFLIENPFVDICILGEGEKPFAEIVQHIAREDNIKMADSIKGTFFLEEDRKTLCENPPTDLFDSLDEIHSPYTEGLFDQFFEDNLHPLVQTTRGCPFTCAFCTMSLERYNKVRRMSMGRIVADLEYCAKRLKSRHDISLMIADSNFGMYPQDVEVAKEIRRIQEQYDWPRYVNLSTGKNKKGNVLKASCSLKWGLPIKLSAQSFNEETLEQIKRSNISIDAMYGAIQYAQQNHIHTCGELIADLPAETKESFSQGIKNMMDINIGEIVIMQLVLLRGTPLAEEETIKENGFNVKYRIIPRAFGEYEGERVVEIEAMVVGTKTLPAEDYMYFRELQLIISIVYNTEMFRLVRRFLVEMSIDQWQWVKKVSEVAKKLPGKAKEQLQDFCKEAQDELFQSKLSIQEFVNDDKSFKKMLNKERGDNLMNKYLTLALSEYDSWMDISMQAAEQLLKEKGVDSKDNKKALENIRRFSKIIYDIAPIFEDMPEAEKINSAVFEFDIQKWKADESLKLVDCREDISYDCSFSEEQIEKMKKIISKGHDVSQTKQFIYRDRKYYTFMPLVKRTKK